MPQRFKATENAIEKGLENATPKVAIGLIESWETELQGAEFTGSKGLIGDLGKLKKELESDEDYVLAKERAWDDWKDDHQRGEGNSKLRPTA